MPRDASDIQREYYARTAEEYDAAHGSSSEDDPHGYGVAKLFSLIESTRARSVLDVGTGTGRIPLALLKRHPGITVHGVEPVAELLEVAARNGVPSDALSVGSGTELPFADDAFDIVCEFGVLHHVPDPAAVVAEMLRVARVGIVISDNNRFGHGPPAARRLKRVLSRVGLWQLTYRATHGGKPYNLSEGDGLAYSYSVFDDYGRIATWAQRLDVCNFGVSSSSSHPYATASHVVLVAARNSSGGGP